MKKIYQLKFVLRWSGRQQVLIALPGSNLDLSCVRQSGAALFFENYAKVYFDAKHLEKVFPFLASSDDTITTIVIFS